MLYLFLFIYNKIYIIIFNFIILYNIHIKVHEEKRKIILRSERRRKKRRKLHVLSTNWHFRRIIIQLYSYINIIVQFIVNNCL